jgi:hypothetical protein
MILLVPPSVPPIQHSPEACASLYTVLETPNPPARAAAIMKDFARFFFEFHFFVLK